MTARGERGALDATATAQLTRPPLARPDLASRFDICGGGDDGAYDAVRAFADRSLPAPKVEAGAWTLFEDRPGKPGWTARGPGNASIEFDLGTVGARTRAGTNLSAGRPRDVQVRSVAKEVELDVWVPRRPGRRARASS